MASLRAPSPLSVLCLKLPSSSPLGPSFLPKLPFKLHFRPTLSSAPAALSAADQDFPSGILASGDGDRKSLPCIRSFQNDIARLTVVGDVAFEQALTAAAADSGSAADEYVATGVPAMVVETVSPGNPDDHSTVSTRLSLPARKVKEKAKKLRSSLTTDILSSTTSRNILAMTFRQVVLHHLRSFELALFSPGSERNMEDLASLREMPLSFSLSSSDGRILSVLAEAVCLCVLKTTERNFLGSRSGFIFSNLFPWFQEPEMVASSDSLVCIYKISEDEIVENAMKLVKNFNSMKGKYSIEQLEPRGKWWPSSIHSTLDKIGGPSLVAWANEYIPAYRLRINADIFKNVKLEGWQRSVDNRWEVLLTHFQMVGLANALDIYYEDQYTLPDKYLPCAMTSDFSKLSKSESSLWKVATIGLAGGCILLSISLVQLCWPRLSKFRRSPKDHYPSPSSDVAYSQHQSFKATELEDLCISVVKRIKDALGWPGDIVTDPEIGVWSGKLPSYLTREKDVDLYQDVAPTRSSSTLESHTSPQMITAQDIACFQVVLSRNGQIIGFQPMSRVAVNHWASNPLAKALYGGQKISPGVFEPRLKIPHPRPDEVIQLELLMSINPESLFALARPV